MAIRINTRRKAFYWHELELLNSFAEYDVFDFLEISIARIEKKEADTLAIDKDKFIKQDLKKYARVIKERKQADIVFAQAKALEESMKNFRCPHCGKRRCNYDYHMPHLRHNSIRVFCDDCKNFTLFKFPSAYSVVDMIDFIDAETPAEIKKFISVYSHYYICPVCDDELLSITLIDSDKPNPMAKRQFNTFECYCPVCGLKKRVKWRGSYKKHYIYDKLCETVKKI